MLDSGDKPLKEVFDRISALALNRQGDIASYLDSRAGEGAWSLV